MTGSQSIDRAAQLLVLVIEGDGATSVGELAQRSGLPKSTVSRAVSALERRGLLQRDGDCPRAGRRRSRAPPRPAAASGRAGCCSAWPAGGCPTPTSSISPD